MELTCASDYENIFWNNFTTHIAFVEILFLFYNMIQRKAGRPSSKDKREPFSFRIKKSVLKALKDRADGEQRAMNTVAENILERELIGNATTR